MMWLPDKNDLTQVAIFRSCARPQKESAIPIKLRQREIKRYIGVVAFAFAWC